nr:Leucine-rich repeat domain containing protein [Haemonchus contortus]
MGHRNLVRSDVLELTVPRVRAFATQICLLAQSAFVWRDHHQQTEKLSCSDLNLPNRGHPYKVDIHHWNGMLTPNLIRGLAEVNVTALRIYDIDETTPSMELAKYTPHLRSLEISARSRQPYDVASTFHHLKMLESIRIFNVGLQFSRTITSFGSHTFSACAELRVLDLSHNPIEIPPVRPFAHNSKLKWLKLSGTNIKELSPKNFVGLGALKSLTLSYSPLQSIAPFAFLPLKSLKTLDLEATNISAIPLAVTQNCGLSHLNVANNILHHRSSLPPEVVVLLSGLTLLKLDGNPLTEFPPSLFTLSTDNFRLIRQLVQTMTSLPVWTEEPCTPYYWAMHLRNRSMTFRNLVSTWSDSRMKREGLAYCREQYEWMIEEMEVYRDLEKNSGCSANRRLRSAARAQKTSFKCRTNSKNKTSTVEKHAAVGNRAELPHFLWASLMANIFFFCLILTFVCVILCCGRKRAY